MSYECKHCGDIICVDEDDYDEILWGHIQMCHHDVFEEVQDFETPYMIEECYNAEQ